MAAWRKFLEGLVAKAGTATKLAGILKVSDTKVSRWRAYQQSFPNGTEAMALAAYAAVPVGDVLILIATAEGDWLALRAQRRAERVTADTSLSPPRKPPVPVNHPLIRTRVAQQFAMAGGR